MHRREVEVLDTRPARPAGRPGSAGAGRSRARASASPSPADGSYDGSRASSTSSPANSSGRRRSSAGLDPRPARAQVAQPVDVGLERRPRAERAERLGQVRVQPGDRDLAERVGGAAVEGAAEVPREQPALILLEGRLVVAAGREDGDARPAARRAPSPTAAPRRRRRRSSSRARRGSPGPPTASTRPITSPNPTPQACSTPSVVARVTSAPLPIAVSGEVQQGDVGAWGEQGVDRLEERAAGRSASADRSGPGTRSWGCRRRCARAAGARRSTSLTQPDNRAGVLVLVDPDEERPLHRPSLRRWRAATGASPTSRGPSTASSCPPLTRRGIRRQPAARRTTRRARSGRRGT